jgi:N-carbamoyl-L-amino-acid hydrolase
MIFSQFAQPIAESLFSALHDASFDGVGITRDSYGVGESAALDIIDAAARAHGLVTERDAAANLVVTLPGTDPSLKPIACGSHLDSVPHGGNFDGGAGVIAGLLCLIHLRDARPRRTLRLYGLRGEESAAFGRAYSGSSALFGRLTPADLELRHTATGRTLRDAMRDVGADIDRIARGETLLDPGSLAAWLELHIEQGPVLVATHIPVAAVTGIRGNVRHREIVCVGEAGHSGAVPKNLRHDAVFAVAELLHRMDAHWQSFLDRHEDLVVTTGVIGTDPAEHAIARIPGKARFSFEARSQSADTLEAYYAVFQAECAAVEREKSVRFDLGPRLDTAPAVMDRTLVDTIRAEINRLVLPDAPMASGAGHDSAVFENAGVPSAMIFIRNEHGSHNPDEAMDIDDFLLGAEILRRSLASLAE